MVPVNRPANAVFAVLLSLVAAETVRPQGPPSALSAGDPGLFTPWQTYSGFEASLSEKSDFYPTEIEGKSDDAGVFHFRAKFARRPGEKYFCVEQVYGVTQPEFQSSESHFSSQGHRQIYVNRFVDALGITRYCGIWMRTFPMLVRQLATSKDDDQRVRIVYVLQQIGKDDIEVQGVLLRTLKRCENEKVRLAVATSLEYVRVERERNVAALVEAAEADGSSPVRLAALKSIGSFPSQAAQSVPLLVDALASDSPAKQSVAAQSLASIYRRVGILKHLDVDRDNPQQAVDVLTRLLNARVPGGIDRQRPDALPPLMPNAVIQPGRIVLVQRAHVARSDPTENLRAGAIEDLGRLGAAAASSIPDLQIALQSDPSSRVRCTAAIALAKIAPQRPDIVAALADSLEQDKPCQMSCVEALKQIGPAARDCIPNVHRVFKSARNKALRDQLMELMGLLGSDSPESVETLVDICQTDPSLTMRTRAATALAEIAPAVEINGRAPVDVCLREALKQLDSSEQFAKAEAARALGILGPRAKVAIGDLIDATTHYSFSVQSAAVTSLSQMGSAARDAVPAIAALLQEKNWRLIPPVAAKALGNMGHVAEGAVPALQECLNSSHPGLCDAAAAAIEKIQGGGR